MSVISNPNTERLITVDELSARLGLHRNTVAKQANDGTLSGIKIGGQWRFDYREVIHDLKNRDPRQRLKR